MSQQFDRLTNPHLCIIVTYATAGLGHLRVAKALIDELPTSCHPILLPDTTSSVSFLHQLTSNNKLTNKFLEFTQQCWAEDIATKLYRFVLQRNATQLKKRLIDLLGKQVPKPTTLLIVATHFSMAHQVTHIKSAIEKELNIQVKLVVQITDDSPQKVWFVPNANYLISPSEYTTKQLQEYGQKEGLGKSPGLTLPYPLSSVLTAPLSNKEFENKVSQANSSSSQAIHVCIPISGAGVGLPFFHSFMKKLHAMEPRITFHVVARRTLFTSAYLRSWKKKTYISVYESRIPTEVITLYEQVYKQHPILVELTKPSEQAFKACIPPTHRGGSILLFTTPVGRQEYDNLNFLRRHKLIPSQELEANFFEIMNSSSPQVANQNTWRGFPISSQSQEAAQWFSTALHTGIFQHLLRWKQTDTSPEVESTGATQFWKTIAQIV